MSELFKPVSAMVIITVVAALLLGYVYAITLEPIAAQRAGTEAKAIGAVFDAADDVSQELPIPEGSPVSRALQVYGKGTLLGYVVFTSPDGYSGAVDIIVGIDVDGAVEGVRILQHSETPGLGANASDPAFIDQYKGKSGDLKITKAAPGDNEIQAVTSATITSAAVTKGVNDALNFFKQSIR
ncbi:MAG: RnfABCDGE type electron transport complex subunit G [Clostridiales bacterium]|nr:RnfABCDGE type electron transport complex subunit G [Clostridiales bacterium]